MAPDASAVLGSPQEAGTFLSPKGLMKKMATQSAGRMAGGLIGSAAGNVGMVRGDKEEAATPAFGQLGYLAVTADDVALVRAKRGAMKPKIVDEVVGRKPRNEVQSVDYDKGSLKGELKIHFADGSRWEFEIPKVHNKTTEAVIRALAPAG
jgi:hypothetical protein